MKSLLLAITFIASCQFSNAQLVVNTTAQTPAELAISVFQSPGVVLSNIKFNNSALSANASSDQIGSFTNGNSTNIGIDSGVIMCTGKATVAIGPNNSGSASEIPTASFQGDSDLALLSNNAIQNIASLEFDFVPQGTNLSFDFVFASEEYPEFVGSMFNDAVGFFINGPGLSGPFSNNSKNIALILPSETPLAINNVNNGYANNGPCMLCNNYVNNLPPAVSTSASTIQFDGFTTLLSAKATLVPNETYHLKIAIANSTDNLYDSALFLKALSIGGLSKDQFKSEQNVFISYPDQNNVVFQTGKTKVIKSIEMYDIGGKLLTVKDFLNVNYAEINLLGLSKGIYFATVNLSDGIKVYKKIMVR